MTRRLSPQGRGLGPQRGARVASCNSLEVIQSQVVGLTNELGTYLDISSFNDELKKQNFENINLVPISHLWFWWDYT